jgi:hypothetical protein
MRESDAIVERCMVGRQSEVIACMTYISGSDHCNPYGRRAAQLSPIKRMFFWLEHAAGKYRRIV